jgi:hypothetical protein
MAIAGCNKLAKANIDAIPFFKKSFNEFLKMREYDMLISPENVQPLWPKSAFGKFCAFLSLASSFFWQMRGAFLVFIKMG